MKNNNQPTLAIFFYEVLLSLYPVEYRKKYGHEMRLLFNDLYNEEIEKHGEVGVGFWFRLIADVIASTFSEHSELLQKVGLKKYASQIFHINLYFTVGLVAVFPFVVLLVFNGIDVLLTGSGKIFSPFYSSFWWLPTMFVTVVALPLVAFFLNVLAIAQAYTARKSQVVSLGFLATQLPNALIVIIALMAFGLLFGHDFVPCMVHHLGSKGLLNFFNFLPVCQKA